jgi:hypothetical protein
VSSLSTLGKRIVAAVVGLLMLSPFLKRVFRLERREQSPAEDLEAAYRRYPQTRDTVETPAAKTK